MVKLVEVYIKHNIYVNKKNIQRAYTYFGKTLDIRVRTALAFI